MRRWANWKLPGKWHGEEFMRRPAIEWDRRKAQYCALPATRRKNREPVAFAMRTSMDAFYRFFRHVVRGNDSITYLMPRPAWKPQDNLKHRGMSR